MYLLGSVPPKVISPPVEPADPAVGAKKIPTSLTGISPALYALSVIVGIVALPFRVMVPALEVRCKKYAARKATNLS